MTDHQSGRLALVIPFGSCASVIRSGGMAVHGMDWLPVIRSFCGSVDAFGCDAGGLAASGVDDVVLRTVVMMLDPKTFLDPRSDARPQRGFDLGPLMDRVLANLAGRVTLSDMEEWSGRTARSIQLAFQKRSRSRGPAACREWRR